MMEDSLQDVSVVRDDGVAGKVTAVTVNGNGSPIAVVRFDDGAQVAVSPQMITPDENGIYRLEVAASRLAPAEDLVIPVVAEEILIGTEQVTRGVVRAQACGHRGEDRRCRSLCRGASHRAPAYQ